MFYLNDFFRITIRNDRNFLVMSLAKWRAIFPIDNQLTVADGCVFGSQEIQIIGYSYSWFNWVSWGNCTDTTDLLVSLLRLAQLTILETIRFTFFCDIKSGITKLYNLLFIWLSHSLIEKKEHFQGFVKGSKHVQFSMEILSCMCRLTWLKSDTAWYLVFAIRQI